MNFKKWLNLQEVGTGTNAIAVFARPIGGMVRRTPLDDSKVRRTPLDLFGQEHRELTHDPKKGSGLRVSSSPA